MDRKRDQSFGDKKLSGRLLYHGADCIGIFIEGVGPYTYSVGLSLQGISTRMT